MNLLLHEPAYCRMCMQGPFGWSQVEKAITRRFGEDRWSTQDKKLIADYLYHISALPASGEYALNSILHPIVSRASAGTSSGQASDDKSDASKTRFHVYAREPVAPSSLAHLASTSSANSNQKRVPVLVLYGDSDWIAFPEASLYVETLRSHGVDAKLAVIRNAGHHLYMDNVDEFHNRINKWHNRITREFCEKLEEGQQK